MKGKTFTPPPLQDVSEDNRIQCATLLSGNYFKVANELREFAKNRHGRYPYHYYVFPALTFYMAAVEAYLQEAVAISLARDNDDEVRDVLEKLNRQAGPYKDFKPWVRKIFELHDPEGKGIDTNSDVYRNLIALRELRNATIHCNQTFIEHVEWPVRLQEAVRRSKIEVINADWVTNLSSPRVAEWAHDTARDVVTLFYRMSGFARDVFHGEKGYPRWE